ncbi:MAG: hypothetical protein AB9819_05565 [Methanomassiliicoccales archaeon]
MPVKPYRKRKLSSELLFPMMTGLVVIFLFLFGFLVVGSQTTDRFDALDVDIPGDVRMVMKGRYADAYALTDDGVYRFSIQGARPMVMGAVRDMAVGDVNGQLVILYENGSISAFVPDSADGSGPFHIDGTVDLIGILDHPQEESAPSYVIVHHENSTGKRLMAVDWRSGATAWSVEMGEALIGASCDYMSRRVATLGSDGNISVFDAASGSLLWNGSVAGDPLEIGLGQSGLKVCALSHDQDFVLSAFDLQNYDDSPQQELHFDEVVHDLRMAGLRDVPCIRNDSALMVFDNITAPTIVRMGTGDDYAVAMYRDSLMVSGPDRITGYRIGDDRPILHVYGARPGHLFIDPHGRMSCSFGENGLDMVKIREMSYGDRYASFFTLFIMLPGLYMTFYINDRKSRNQTRYPNSYDLVGLRVRVAFIGMGAAVAFLITWALPDAEWSELVRNAPVLYAAVMAVSVAMVLSFSLTRLPASRGISFMLFAAAILGAFLPFLVSAILMFVLWGTGLEFGYGNVIDALAAAISPMYSLAARGAVIAVIVTYTGRRWVQKRYPKMDADNGDISVEFKLLPTNLMGAPRELAVIRPTDRMVQTRRRLTWALAALSFAAPLFVAAGYLYLDVLHPVLVAIIAISILIILLLETNKFKLDMDRNTEPFTIYENGILAFTNPLFSRDLLNGFIPRDRVQKIIAEPLDRDAVPASVRLTIETRDGHVRDIGVRSKEVAERVIRMVKEHWEAK